jgi:YHS domain-containing protein
MKSLFCIVLCASLTIALTDRVVAETAKKDDVKAAKPINKKCPVEGGDVDPEVTIQHDGKTIGFCCAGCDEEFKKDPAKFMAIIAKEQKDAATDAKKGGGEKEEPKLNAKCPVSGDDADKTITKEYKGRTIAFCCEDCVKDFDKDPKKYMAKLEAAEKAEKDAKKDSKKDQPRK